MVELIKHGVYLLNGKEIRDEYTGMTPDEARENTITYGILRAHDVDGAKGKKMRIRFDAMMSHDITYVGIIQTARASGLEEFPLPYAMTNCHNSLCAVGGTINEDDHVFGLSAAKKYGGIYVPANQAVIHQYAREMMVKCGNMILGSDSHTRYGSLGNMGVGEGGGELVKQLLRNTWDINAPEVVLVWLEGKPKKGVGPHDVAISLVKATFESGVVKNKVLEFAGPGVKELPIDFRNGIDIMTTETTCLSSIWVTDDEVKHHYDIHERPNDYRELQPGHVAYYDMMIRIDLSQQEAMIALPFHPSNAVTIHELQADPVGILTRIEEDAKKRFGTKVDVHLVDKVVDGKVHADQGIIAGCSGGTYDNLAEAGAILKGKSIGNDYFTASAYPQSTPVSMAVTREGITAATDVAYENTHKPYQYDDKIYKCRVYNGFGKARPETELRYGPNIKDWPTMYPMAENMLVELAAVIHDPVTTTDELIPSGETSSYRSNPLKLSEFALSRRVPEYVGLSKAIQQQDLDRRAGNVSANVAEALKAVGANAENTSFGSCVFANRPGDGSAREQAASCQKVLGGDANICYEYATKRYRSNCINWGIVPFTIAPETTFDFQPGDKVFIPGIREAILEGKEEIDAQVITANGVQPIHLFFQNLTANERQILVDGCLMNYYKNLK